MEVSRQEQIDKVMCRPGYRWNETLGRCVGGSAMPDSKTNSPSLPTPDTAIQDEIASRQNTGEV
jgi:hypothetical protein